jgi:starch phosphorylase
MKEIPISVEKFVSTSLYNLPQAEIEGFDSLAELALDLRWSWNHAADELWRRLDPALWELTPNPWVVLQTVSRDQLKKMLSDAEFRMRIEEILGAKRAANWNLSSKNSRKILPSLAIWR